MLAEMPNVGECAPHHRGERQGKINVAFGSKAALWTKCSPMSAFERKAAIHVPDFVGKIWISWIAIANVCFHQ